MAEIGRAGAQQNAAVVRLQLGFASMQLPANRLGEDHRSLLAAQGDGIAILRDRGLRDRLGVPAEAEPDLASRLGVLRDKLAGQAPRQ